MTEAFWSSNSDISSLSILSTSFSTYEVTDGSRWWVIKLCRYTQPSHVNHLVDLPTFLNMHQLTSINCHDIEREVEKSSYWTPLSLSTAMPSHCGMFPKVPKQMWLAIKDKLFSVPNLSKRTWGHSPCCGVRDKITETSPHIYLHCLLRQQIRLNLSRHHFSSHSLIPLVLTSCKTTRVPQSSQLHCDFTVIAIILVFWLKATTAFSKGRK